MKLVVLDETFYSSYSVSQHAMALLLEIVNRVSNFVVAENLNAFLDGHPQNVVNP